MNRRTLMAAAGLLAGQLPHIGSRQAFASDVAPAGSKSIDAQDIVLGVNIHPGYDAKATISAMRDIGFRHFRMDTTSSHLNDALAEAGMLGCYICSDAPPSVAGQLGILERLELRRPGAVAFIEGRNEVNNHRTVYGGFEDSVGGDQSKRSAALLFMRNLYKAAKSTPALKAKSVLGFTDIHPVAAECDIANAHAYDGDTDSWPDYWPAHVAQEMMRAMPGKPMALTEYGVKHFDRQITLIPQWIAASLLAGIHISYLYALQDDSETYGVYDRLWAPKPVVEVLGKYGSMLAPKDKATSLHPLKVTIDEPGVNSVLVRRSDHAYAHLIWRSWPRQQPPMLSWSYDRPVSVLCHADGAGLASKAWTLAANEVSHWRDYQGGVVLLELQA